MSIKQMLKDLFPPLLVRAARGLTKTGRSSLPEAGRPEWEYVPQGWDAEKTDPAIKGWNVQTVLDAYKAKWETFVKTTQGAGPFGLPPEAVSPPRNADLPYHNGVMVFGYCLALASRSKGAVSILDWGGGIGHYYLIARALLPDLNIEYHCKDVPLLAQHGATLFPEARFHSDESCLLRRYDFVMAGTSLHYARDWRGTLRGLAGATANYLLVTGLPVVHTAPAYVFVQRPYQYHYDTEYLAWCLNRNEFLQTARGLGLHLVREFITGYRPPIRGAPEECEYRGYLFRPE
jgi:putative methyltransferase (TIGR04325 family)